MRRSEQFCSNVPDCLRQHLYVLSEVIQSRTGQTLPQQLPVSVRAGMDHVARRKAMAFIPQIREARSQENIMENVLIPLGAIILWFVLKVWLLPRLGVPT